MASPRQGLGTRWVHARGHLGAAAAPAGFLRAPWACSLDFRIERLQRRRGGSTLLSLAGSGAANSVVVMSQRPPTFKARGAHLPIRPTLGNDPTEPGARGQCIQGTWLPQQAVSRPAGAGQGVRLQAASQQPRGCRACSSGHPNVLGATRRQELPRVTRPGPHRQKGGCTSGSKASAQSPAVTLGPLGRKGTTRHHPAWSEAERLQPRTHSPRSWEFTGCS